MTKRVNLPDHAKLPVYLMCAAFCISLLLLILPIDQILVTYKVVNGVKTVEFVSKTEGVLRILSVSTLAGLLWIFVNKKLYRKYPCGTNKVERPYWVCAIGFYFGAITSVGSLMGILSIILWIRGL